MASKWNSIETPEDFGAAVFYYLILWTGGSILTFLAIIMAMPLIFLALLPFFA